MTFNSQTFEQSPPFNGQALPGAFLTSLVVERCQTSCESVAKNLREEAAEHEVINDFLSACDEFSTATARDSRHRNRYAAFCAERCSETATVCEELGDASSRRAARWCRLLLAELQKELHWKDVKKVMNSDINWSGVKDVLNKEVKMPWGG